MKTINLAALLAALATASHGAETLEDIIVTTASNTEQSLKQTTSDTVVITSEDIEERGYQTLAEVLTSIPDFSYSQNGGEGQVSSLMLRGMDTDNVLVMIDGIRYNDITSPNGASYEHLLVGDIDRIEIIKGAQSGVWGADASAGVINIITKKTKSGLHGTLQAQAGSFGSKRYSAGLSYANSGYYINIHQTRLNSDGFSAMANINDNLDDLEDDGYENITTSLRAGAALDEHNKVDLGYIDIDAKADGDGWNPATYLKDPNSIYNSINKSQLFSVNYNYKDGTNEANLYTKHSKFKREYPQATWTSLYEGSVKEYGLNYKRRYRSSDFVMIGASMSNFTQDDTMNRSYKNSAIYATNSNEFSGLLGGKLIVTESIRHDKFDAFDNKTTGKFGLKYLYLPIDGLSASFNYGTGYKVPTLFELYGFAGNSSLSPEESKTMDFTIAYKGASATYFRNRINDMIGYNMSTYKYYNLDGESKIDGISLSFKHALSENLYASAGYTKLIHATNSLGEDLGRRAKSKMSLSLDYYGIEKLHLGVSAQYVGERYDSSNKQGKQTGKYSTVSVSADYQISENIKVDARIENLTDKKYQTVDGYASSPRAFYAGIKISF